MFELLPIFTVSLYLNFSYLVSKFLYYLLICLLCYIVAFTGYTLDSIVIVKVEFPPLNQAPDLTREDVEILIRGTKC